MIHKFLSHSVDFLFSLLKVYFSIHNFQIFINPSFLFFSFVACAFVFISNKSFPNSMLWSSPLMFSSKRLKGQGSATMRGGTAKMVTHLFVCICMNRSNQQLEHRFLIFEGQLLFNHWGICKLYAHYSWKACMASCYVWGEKAVGCC